MNLLKEQTMLSELKLNDLLEEISSKSPAPGGGTVSSITAAFSAALISMVCQLTVGKKSYRHSEDEINKALEQVNKLRKEFLLLGEKDAEVFNEIMNAYGLPKESDEEKQERSRSIEEASKRASLVPMDVLRRCETTAQFCLAVARKGNEDSVSDAGVAAILIHAAAQGASLNILMNLSTISDDDFVGKLKTEQAKVLKTIKDLADETLNVVHGKI